MKSYTYKKYIFEKIIGVVYISAGFFFFFNWIDKFWSLVIASCFLTSLPTSFFQSYEKAKENYIAKFSDSDSLDKGKENGDSEKPEISQRKKIKRYLSLFTIIGIPLLLLSFILTKSTFDVLMLCLTPVFLIFFVLIYKSLKPLDRKHQSNYE